MSEFSANERRLIAALDRIDYSIEVYRARDAEAAEAAARAQQENEAAREAALNGEGMQELLAEARAQNEELAADLAALHDRQAGAMAALQARLNEATERLAGAGTEAGRLAKANDDLAAANRGLMAALDGGGDTAGAIRVALEAEIVALRAARSAEIAQMGDILAALERMIGAPAAPVVPEIAAELDESDEAVPDDAETITDDAQDIPAVDGANDDTETPEDETPQPAAKPAARVQDHGSLFASVYAESEDDVIDEDGRE